jgi:hypothetical protein
MPSTIRLSDQFAKVQSFFYHNCNINVQIFGVKWCSKCLRFGRSLWFFENFEIMNIFGFTE